MIFSASRELYSKDAAMVDGVISFVIPDKGKVTSSIVACSDKEATAIRRRAAELKVKHKAAIEAEYVKAQQQRDIDYLTVEVDGFVFKANDKSIARMRSALDANSDFKAMSHAEIKRRLGLPDGFDIDKLLSTISWKLCDETFQEVTLSQLRTAHGKAILAIGSILLANA